MCCRSVPWRPIRSNHPSDHLPNHPQALFYTGYMLACIPGGYLASRSGGRLVLPVALGAWSIATFVAPLAAATVPTLSLTR